MLPTVLLSSVTSSSLIPNLLAQAYYYEKSKGPIWAGLFLLGLAALFYFFFQKNKKKEEQVAQTSQESIKNLQEISASVSKDIGAGSFRQTCFVQGTIQATHTLVSEIAQQACVYYRTSVTREYEETYTEYNNTTKNHETRTRRGSETISSNRRSVNFTIDDGTGSINVDVEGAEWEEESFANRFVPEISLINIGSRRTLGVRYEEWGMPLGKRAYVLGEASDKNGLAIAKPEKDGQLLISLRSREQILASASRWKNFFKIAAIACAVLGIVSIVSYLF